MQIQNLTNPGALPAAGDQIIKTYPNGATERIAYTIPPADPRIMIETVVWLREHLGGHYEQVLRVYANSPGEPNSQEVAAFVSAIDARMSVGLVLSDKDYPQRIAMAYQLALLPADLAGSLISLGGHDVAQYI